MNRRFATPLIFVFSVLLLLIAGCAGTNFELDSAKKTNHLQPGMAYAEVVSILGEPKQTQVVGERLVGRWILQEKWVGFVPYDMVFDPKTRQLVSWSRNEKYFEESQKQLQVISDVLVQGMEEASSGGGTSLTGPNDANLQRQFAVKLYRFSAVGGGQTGGSETSITLCADGRMFSSGESGYSGGGWGTASQSGDAGRWRIQGNMQQGKIVTVQSGKAWEYEYSRGSDYVVLGSTKYAISGRSGC